MKLALLAALACEQICVFAGCFLDLVLFEN